VRNSGGRSFQWSGAVMDMARLRNMIQEETGGRERLRPEDDLTERVCWMVKTRESQWTWSTAESCRVVTGL